MCLAHTQTVSEFAGQADMPPFAAGLIDTINKGSATLAISLGQRLGLFDAMRNQQERTPAEWADRTGLQERYLAEWLGAMTTAGITATDEEGRYYLPDDHALFLGDGAPEGNMASMMQWIGVLAPVEDEIIRCFRKGGGVPYSAYPRFHQVMEEEGSLTFDLDATLGLVPGLVQRLEQGIDVLDVGCGRGRALRMMAERFPHSSFIGYDLSCEAIDDARHKGREFTNLSYQVLDCMKMDDEAQFDLVFTFDAIHDQPHPDVLLTNIRQALRPDGIYIAQDIWARSKVADNLDHPLAPFIYTISLMHCMTVSLAQGGVGLGAAWGQEQALALFKKAGFDEVEVHRLEHDIQNAYYVCRP